MLGGRFGRDRTRLPSTALWLLRWVAATCLGPGLAQAQPDFILPLGPPALDRLYAGYLEGRVVGSSPGNAISTGSFGTLAPFVTYAGELILIQPDGFPETELAAGGGTQVSRDGSTVVGFIQPQVDSPAYHAFRWTKAGNAKDLGTLGPVSDLTYNSVATDVSSDGAVVVGYSLAPAGPTGAKEHAFRWTQAGGLVDLGSAAGQAGFSRAFGVSADGRVIVGVSQFPGGARHAFRHTAAGGFQDLGAFDGAFFNSVATAVTADGSVVVGQSDSAGRSRAFRWTETGGLQDLGVIDGDSESAATGISDDGALVVGISSAEPLTNENGALPYFLFHTRDRPFVWMADKGMVDLNELSAEPGVANAGLVIVAANGVSAEGTLVAAAGRTQDLDPGDITAVLLRLSHPAAAEPTLLFRRVGDKLELTWPAASGFVLETTASLDRPSWTKVAGADASSASLPMFDRERFFRLRQ